MPRLGEQLRDISTEAQNITPGTYTASLKVEDTLSKSKKPMVVFTYTIQGTEFDGRTLKDYNVLVKNDGTPNEGTLRTLKRISISLLGEDRVSQDDFDTAELNDMLVSIIVKDDSFEDADTGEQVPTSKVKRILGPA